MVQEFRGSDRKCVEALNLLSTQLYETEKWFYRHNPKGKPDITIYLGHLEQYACDTLERHGSMGNTFKGYPVVRVHQDTHSVVHLTNYRERVHVVPRFIT